MNISKLPFGNMEACTGCGLCMVQCVQKCIYMNKDKEGFYYPVVDNSRCIKCGICQLECPNNQIEIMTENEIVCYASWNNDDEIRYQSSSGGIFSAIAEVILSENGVVYAAALENEMELNHIRIDNVNDLQLVRKSKYFQSNIINIFSQINLDLKNKEKILFIGTPCQVVAIKEHVKSKKLICVDLICHGVTSREVVQQYIRSKERKIKSKVLNTDFRTKETINTGTVMKHSFENGSIMYEPSRENTYMRGFNSNLFLRLSCYKCKYANLKRVGDITLGDFWGIGSMSEFPYDQSNGISLVLCNTLKGKEIINILDSQNKCSFVKRNIEEALPKNQTLNAPVEFNRWRKVFFLLFDKIDFDRLIYVFDFQYFVKYYTRKYMIWIKKKLVNIMHRE